MTKQRGLQMENSISRICRESHQQCMQPIDIATCNANHCKKKGPGKVDLSFRCVGSNWTKLKRPQTKSRCLFLFSAPLLASINHYLRFRLEKICCNLTFLHGIGSLYRLWPSANVLSSHPFLLSPVLYVIT